MKYIVRLAGHLNTGGWSFSDRYSAIRWISQFRNAWQSWSIEKVEE